MARRLEAVGERVQYSVFEIYMTDKELDGIMGQVDEIIDQGQDSVRVYNLCQNCQDKILTSGVGEISEPPDVTIV